jgi:hypothetical protein
MGLWDPFEQGVLDSVPVYDFKKLEIVRTLGQGFYGVVRLVRYQGKHSGTKLQAAFKHLKDEHRGDIDKEKMLQEEAMAMLSLDSNHTVKCLGKRSVSPYIKKEFTAGLVNSEGIMRLPACVLSMIDP